MNDDAAALGFGPAIGSPYNFLRGPTNLQAAPRLTRCSSICGVHTGTTFSVQNWTTCLDTGSSFFNFFDCIDHGMGGVHSFAHRWLGGAWGASDGNCAFKQDGPAIADTISGCLVCPACSAGDGADARPCVCARNESACALAAAGAAAACQRYPGGDGHEWAPEGPCSSCPQCADGELGANGDFWDGATSPNDPVFWFHHPNVDRLFMEWQLRWGRGARAALPLPHSGFPEAGFCPGHNRGDVISATDPFLASLVGASGAAGAVPLTHAALLEATIPLGSAPYTYDTLIGEREPSPMLPAAYVA